MGITKTTYHVRNFRQANYKGENDSRRLIILFDDIFEGINPDSAKILKEFLELWIGSMSDESDYEKI